VNRWKVGRVVYCFTMIDVASRIKASPANCSDVGIFAVIQAIELPVTLRVCGSYRLYAFFDKIN